MYKRILTGLSLGVVMISALLVNELTAIVLLFTIAIFSCFEWRKCFLVPKKKRNIFIILSLVLLLSGLIISFGLDKTQLRKLGNLLCIASIIQILIYIVSLRSGTQSGWFAKIGPGILYIVFPTIAAIFFVLDDFILHRWLLLSFIIINWSNDTMAYFGGKLYGNTPLAPSISPKKTIEGSATGLIFGILAFYLCNQYFNFELSLIQIIIISISIVIAGALGDLFESSLKRLVQIKDSGKLLPGHGGFLDRFDSFYFVLPVGILLYYTFIHSS